MLKKLTRSLLIPWFFIPLLNSSIEQKTVLIMNMENVATLPRRFRTTKDPFKGIETIFASPTRLGFDHLNLSGSAQFSDLSLKTLLKELKNPPQFYLIDLRQECHGFINQNAVSWYGVKNWANLGKTTTEIEDQEQELLAQLLKSKQTFVEKIIKKHSEEEALPTTTKSLLMVKNVSTERQLAEKYGVGYFRIPVTDHMKPSDDAIDRFISIVNKLPKNHWLHMHCAGGCGRSTTFMTMYDMMKNSSYVSMKDIFKRQKLIGGCDLQKTSKSLWKEFSAQERLQFLQAFYQYCRSNRDNFETSWSRYLFLNRLCKFFEPASEREKNYSVFNYKKFFCEEGSRKFAKSSLNEKAEIAMPNEIEK